MRDILNIITQHKDEDYENIIWEYSLIEARFIKNKDYVTADNNFISCKLWMKTWEIQQKYCQRNLKVNTTSLINSGKFNYLELIESKAKN